MMDLIKYKLELEQANITDRIRNLILLKKVYQDSEEYEMCESINNLIEDYCYGRDYDLCHIKYSTLINRYIKLLEGTNEALI